MRFINPLVLFLTCIVIAFSSGIAQATTLIRDDEALLPNDNTMDVSTRAITRGPSIETQATDTTPLAHVPFSFVVHFVPHGGAKIDPTSVHILYTKVPAIDLTERLRPYITAQGIELPDAIVPEGKHILRVSVGDSDGRLSSAFLDIQAHKP